MTAPAVEDRAAALVRRQLIVTALGVALVLLIMAFAQSQQAPTPANPVEQYVQAHQPPNPGSPQLAYAQVVVAAVVAIVTLGHAAQVAAFVFRRKVS